MKSIKYYIAALLFMAYSAAHAQGVPYLNVHLEDGTYKSFKVTPNLKVGWSKIKETKGTAKAIIPVENVNVVNGYVVDVPWVQLWEGGPKFAEYNVGVIDGKAWSYGGYYSWGGSQSGSNTDYNTGTSALSDIYDTATKLWGANWRMPTRDDITNLRQKCVLAWVGNYNNTGISGLVITGKGDYNENSIFLPASGYYSNGTLTSRATGCYYRTSIVRARESDGVLQALYYEYSEQDNSLYWWGKSYGMSVRAVLVE